MNASQIFTPQVRSIVLGLLLIGASVLVAKKFIASKQPPARTENNALRQVQQIEVKNGLVRLQISLQGRLQALERIDLFAEVQGVMREGNTAFRAGNRFQKGDLLMLVDPAEARAALVAQRSQFINNLSQVLPDIQLDYPGEAAVWKNYLRSLHVESAMPVLPETSSETFRLFLTARGIPAAWHNLQSAEVRFGKYRLTAPFSGVLTDALVSAGSLVRPGQALGTFINDAVFELEAAVAPEELAFLELGMPCAFHSTDIPGQWTGTLKRINQKVDPGTQTVRIYFEVRGNDLKEGIYLSGELPSSAIENAMAIPRKLLVQDRFLFLIKEDVLTRIEPTIAGFTEESAVITGLPNGAKLLADQLAGAHDGMQIIPIKVDQE